MSAAKCRSCLGTGWQMLANSAFIDDGYRRQRCGICGGSGRSSFPAAPGFEAWQKRVRAHLSALDQEGGAS